MKVEPGSLGDHLGRNDQVNRILKIIQKLDQNFPRSFSLQDFKNYLEEVGLDVSLSTLRRDINVVASYVPLERTVQDESTQLFRLKSKNHHPFIGNSADPAVLATIHELLQPHSSSFLTPYLLETIQKLTGQKLQKNGNIPPIGAQNPLSTKPPLFKVDIHQSFSSLIPADLAETLRKAIHDRRVFKVDYNASTEQKPRTRVLSGHFLYHWDYNLYLVGRDQEDKASKPRPYSLGRMRNIRLENRLHSENLSTPDQVFKHSFGVYLGEGAPELVTLEFDKSLAGYASERVHHLSQTHDFTQDGKVRLTFHVHLTPDFINWVQGFGSRVEVIAPLSLKNQLIREAQQFLIKSRAG